MKKATCTKCGSEGKNNLVFYPDNKILCLQCRRTMGIAQKKRQWAGKLVEVPDLNYLNRLNKGYN